MSESVITAFKRCIFIQVLFFLLGGCSLFGIGEKEPGESPEELMSQGISEFRDGDYQDAIEAFQKLKDRYPYSTLAIQAQLKMADALFKRKEFEEALALYIEFEKLHPTNESIPYTIYQQGRCHFLRMDSIDRDQTSTKDALKEFERLCKEFPKNSFCLQAKRHIRKCYSNLAEHEFYVGSFYFKAGHYLAALRRFEYLIKHYPDLGLHGKALNYIARCRDKLAEEKSLL
ncbi:MAG: outer membrane protein assembly factor BamD [Thermodesulfobacteriota bacterium]